METLGVPQAVMDQVVVMPVTAKMPILLKKTKILVARMAMSPLVKTAAHPVMATDRMTMAQEREELKIRMEKLPAQALLHHFVLQHVLETQSASTGSAQQSETLLLVEHHPTVSYAYFADKLHRLVSQALPVSTTSASLLMDRWAVVPLEQIAQLTMLASRTLV